MDREGVMLVPEDHATQEPLLASEWFAEVSERYFQFSVQLPEYSGIFQKTSQGPSPAPSRALHWIRWVVA